VRHVPSGSRVDANDNVFDSSGTMVQHYEPCPYPAILGNLQGTSSSSSDDGAPPPNIGHDWVEFTYQYLSGASGFNALTGDIQVPPYPYPNTIFNTQTLYFFTALEPVFNAFPLLQPVLEFGLVDDGCPSTHYCINDYFLTGNNNVYYGDYVIVTPGDSIETSMRVSSTAYFDGISFNNWTIFAKDQNTGSYAEGTFSVIQNDYMTFAAPSVMEVYDINYCSQYPNNSLIYFTSLELFRPGYLWTDYDSVSLNMSQQVDSGDSPNCGYSIADSNSYAYSHLYY
jgi:hypothetical protein